MSRQLGPASPLTPNSVDSFAARYGGLGTPTDNPYSGGPYGAARPPFQHSPPNSQRPSGSSSDMSGRPSAHSSMARPPSSSSSVNRSSDGRMGFGRPVPNRDSNRSFGTAASASAEDALHRHYTVLRQYLASSLRDEKGNLKPNRARDKLLRLSATQFMELSTDVYDELMRREDDRLQRVRNVPRFLLPRQNFHPKRNQARQKLSTLPAERFRQLGTDVFYELERRTPRFATGDFDRPPSTSSSANRSLRGPPPRGASIPGNEGNIDGFPNRPLPKTLQQNTIVPNKGTMVEEDEEDDDESAFGLDHVVQSPVNTQDREKIEAQEAEIAELKSRLEGLETKVVENTELRHKVEDLESKLADHEELEQKHTDVKNRNDMLQRDIDERITSAQQLRDDLERELDELKRSKAEDEREIQALREQATSRDTQVSNQDDEQQIERLQHNLAEQEKVTNEVREQAMSYLQDMRDLSKQNDRAIEQEEKLAAQVTKLEQEIEQWRQRYAKVKAQNKSLRASTIGLGLQTTFDSHSLLRQEGILSGDGLVKDVHVTHFQMAIDELLKTARQPSSEPMLESVKNVVVCVQSITSAIGTDGYPTPSPSPLSPDSKREPPASVGRLKARVTGTANSLITATKQHSSSHGLSPVVLLDAAASNLTSSVVELVKAVGIRPSSAAGAIEDDVNMDSYYEDDASEDFGHDEVHIAVPQTNGHHAAASMQDQAGRKKGDGGWFGGWGKKTSIDDSARHDYTAADHDPYR